MRGLALNNDGSVLFVGDSSFNTIFIVRPQLPNGGSDPVSGWPILAGSGPAANASGGYSDGVGTNALFLGLTQLVFLDGSLFVSDYNNNRIRQIVVETQTVTTFAGDGGDSRFQEGVGIAASFSTCAALAYAAGTLYSFDNDHKVAFQITIESAFVSPFTTPPASFVEGLGLDARFSFDLFAAPKTAFDSRGNLIVADSGNHRIRSVSPIGLVSTLAGTGNQGNTDGPALTATFGNPTSITVLDNDDIIIADSVNHNVRMFHNATATIELFAGSPNGVPGFVDGCGKIALFNRPLATSVGPNQSILVLESLTTNNALRMINTSRCVSTLALNINLNPDHLFGYETFMSVVLTADETILWSAGCGLRMLEANGNVSDYAGSSLCRRSDVVAFDHVVTDVVRGLGSEVLTSQVGASRILNVSTDGNASYLFNHLPSPYAVYGVAVDGPTNGSAIASTLSLAINTQGQVFYSAYFNRVGRLGVLAGAACLPDASTTTCAPGTWIDWDARTCRPCPAGASANFYAFSSYCVDDTGHVIPNVAPPDASATAAPPNLVVPAAIGGSLAAAVLGLLVALLLRRRSAQLAAASAAAMGASGEANAVSLLVSNINQHARRGLFNTSNAATPAAIQGGGEIFALSFTDLEPDASVTPLFGGFSMVFCARWVSRGIRVAVKVRARARAYARAARHCPHTFRSHLPVHRHSPSRLLARSLVLPPALARCRRTSSCRATWRQPRRPSSSRRRRAWCVPPTAT